MFNWICPKCGSEVLASYSECPNCTKTGANPQAPQPVAAQAAPPAVTQTIGGTPPPAARVAPAKSILFGAPPVQQAAQQPPVYQAPAPQPYYPPQQAPQPVFAQPAARRGMPTWLMSVLFAIGFAVVLGGGYYLLNHNKGDSASAASGTAAPATGAAAKANPMQKFIEVTGVRLFQDAKKGVEAKFLIVNHSDAEVNDLGGTVSIRARTMKAGEEPVGTFKFMVKSVAANEAKEATAPVDTKLKVYELPDWQLVETQVQITSPQ